MALVSSAIISYLILCTSYSQGTRETIDFFFRAEPQIQAEFDRATTSPGPLVLFETPERNWLSLGSSTSGDQPKTKTVEKSTEINYLSSNEKGEPSYYLGKDSVQRQELNEQINSRTSKNSKYKNRATEVSSNTIPQWPTWSEENELRQIGTESRIIGQSAQTKPSGSTLPRENFRLFKIAGPSITAAESTAYPNSQSGILNYSPKLSTYWGLKSGEIYPAFQIYDPRTFHSSEKNMHEMDFSLQLSAPQDKNHFRTVDTAIMPLERMGEQTSQELDNSSDLRSEMQNRFKKVNLDLSRAPLIHESNHLSASCDTEQVLNDEVRGAINGFKNNQRKGKRNNSIAHEALPKNKKNKTFDTELSESVFKHEGNNEGVVIMPHNVITFEDALMELINPEEPLIRSDLFKIYLLRAEKIKENQKKNIVTNVINLIEERYSIIKKEYFYVTDFEVRKFLTVKIYQGLKLNPHLNQRNQSQSFERTFLTEIRAKIEAINFENLVKHFVEVNRLNSFSNLKGNQTFGFQLRRNSYIEKLFLVHSIMVNKIFCGESKDESFIARQKDSIEFYDSVFKKIKVDKSGNSFMSTDTFSKIDEPLRKKIGLDKKIISFNNCSFDLRQNQERAQFRMAWILIELWLAFCRPHLYNQLNHGNIIQSSFKPFLNTLIKINWLIFQ